MYWNVLIRKQPHPLIRAELPDEAVHAHDAITHLTLKSPSKQSFQCKTLVSGWFIPSTTHLRYQMVPISRAKGVYQTNIHKVLLAIRTTIQSKIFANKDVKPCYPFKLNLTNSSIKTYPSSSFLFLYSFQQHQIYIDFKF